MDRAPRDRFSELDRTNSRRRKECEENRNPGIPNNKVQRVQIKHKIIRHKNTIWKNIHGKHVVQW